MRPASNLIYLLQHVSNIVGKRTEQALQEQAGIGISQFNILMALEWNPRVSQRVIADGLGQTEASVSRQVKVLTARGLLVSRPDPANRRKYIVTPTTKGMQLTETASGVLRRVLDSEISGAGDERIEELYGSLQKLHQAVCRPDKPGSCNHQLGL